MTECHYHIRDPWTNEKEDSKPGQKFQSTFRFLSKEKENKQKESSTIPSSVPKTTYEKTKSPAAERTKTALSNKTEKPKTVKPNLYSARPKTIKKEVRKPAKSTYFSKRTPAKKQVISEPESELSMETEKQLPTQEVKTVAAESDSQKSGSVWNKKNALLGSGALIIAALILFKIARVRYRKQTLFPTRVIEIQGKYAVIDHGETDGIKTDDIIRLYRKTGRQVQYKGKIKVNKVGENYSSVELFKLQRGQKLEISDVGFRDRNLFAAAFKQFRIIISASLRGLAKGIQFTAKYIDVKSDELAVDLRFSSEKPNNEVRTVVPENQQVVRVTPSPVTTAKPSNNSKSWEFEEA